MIPVVWLLAILLVAGLAAVLAHPGRVAESWAGYRARRAARRHGSA